MEKIDSKYKINLVGKYNRGIYKCHSCNTSLLFNNEHGLLYEHIIGFAESNLGSVMVIECPCCFEKWYCHFIDDTYNYFIDSLKNNKHFK